MDKVQHDELRKKLAKEVADRIKQAQKEGHDPMTEDTVRNLINAEIDKAIESYKFEEKGRVAGEFSTKVYDPSQVERGLDNEMNNPFSFASKIYSTTRELKQWGHSDNEVQAIREIQELHTKVYLYGVIASERLKMNFYDAVLHSSLYKQYRERIKSDDELRKALDTATAGEGAEFIPTALAGNIIERTEMALDLPAQFETINMPTNPYKYPVESGEATVYLVGEAKTDEPSKIPATTPGTGDFTFTAKGIAGRSLISYELDEDAIIAVLPTVENQLVEGLAKGLENAIINGDDSAVHQDSDVTDPSDVRKGWKGLRYYGLNAASGTINFATGNPTVTLLAQVMALSNQYAARPKDNIWVIGPKVNAKFKINQSLGVLTIDKYGPEATVKTGELGQWGGSSIIATPYSREDLNASGKYDGVVTNRGTILYVHKPGFKIGRRRAILVESQRLIAKQQIELVASMRVAFKSPWDPTNASYPLVSAGINLRTT